MSRTVTLVLVDADGVPLGVLPAYDVPAPWWQEVADVVAGARSTHGVEVTVLRLLHTERPVPHGGAVGYLAQLAPSAPKLAELSALDPAVLTSIRTPEPLRAAWAQPGGPARSLRWAADELTRLGRGGFTGSQQRAWNLSTIWRLDPEEPAGSGTPVWLKQVPPFFRHEATVLRWLGREAPDLAPALLAADDHNGRMLLDHVPGDDWYGVDVTGRDTIAADQHRIQLASVPYAQSLVDRGVPDRRGALLTRTVVDTLVASGVDLSGVRRLLDDLDHRLAAIAGCGLPDTLVHGDLHPGNVRYDDGRRVLIDWGDAFVGHPAFDILRLSEGLTPDESTALVRSWAERWRSSRPGSDPESAVRLLRPLAALRNAAVYADFVNRIEPSERVFHRADVPHYLDEAARLAG
ncbi:aminoglycoside phosphotransferase family protein [Micromonospora sp. NBC_01796]|uniref:aminoglycoside phosphotransferase family protein n=1 Tax=Micromonospora sp. NBC_01796 TaxID=2975987 RepID=UPI002DD8ADFC|nr:aminoglycoside phosphotransferase family protein [Micromonospora sp. NBC_01796]WSA86269.1 aminoglycoside phosphotransferase family protein [Micromonospora sp. NBC_01796]